MSTGYNPTNEFSFTLDVDSRAVGVSGVLGAEWFATKQISFVAEYIMSLEYQSTKQKRIGTRQGYYGLETSESEYASPSFRYDLALAKFGFSVYF